MRRPGGKSVGPAPAAAGWWSCARTTFKPLRRRINGRAARCCRCARARTARCGWGPRAPVCIAFKTMPGPILVPPQGIRNPYIWSLAEDAAGRLWAGTWGGGLFTQNGDHFEFAPGMENVTPPMPALLRAREGGLWVGTAMGLLRYQEGKLTWFTENNGQTAARCAHGGGRQPGRRLVWHGRGRPRLPGKPAHPAIPESRRLVERFHRMPAL